MAKPRTINWTNTDEAAARAAEIGFPFEVLLPTIETWIAFMNSGTELHADNYAGLIAWHESIRMLRLEGRQFALEKLARSNVELCFCPRTSVAVMIVQGDARTGDASKLNVKPRTKYPRGPMSCDVLDAQMSMFPEERAVAAEQAWVLLLHMTALGETRAELSRPSVIHRAIARDGSETGIITDWNERIFLGTFERGRLTSAIPTDLSPTDAVVVPLKKRA